MIYGVFNLGTGRLPLPISGYGLDEHLILPTVVLAAGPTLRVAPITAGMPELGQLVSDFWAKILRTSWVPFFVVLSFFANLCV